MFGASLQEVSSILILFVLGITVVYRARSENGWYSKVPGSFGVLLRFGLKSVPKPFSKQASKDIRSLVLITIWTCLASVTTLLLISLLIYFFSFLFPLIPAFFIAMLCSIILADVLSLTVMGLWLSKSKQ